MARGKHHFLPDLVASAYIIVKKKKIKNKMTLCEQLMPAYEQIGDPSTQVGGEGGPPIHMGGWMDGVLAWVRG
jgi:hypothetical protein